MSGSRLLAQEVLLKLLSLLTSDKSRKNIIFHLYDIHHLLPSSISRLARVRKMLGFLLVRLALSFGIE